VQVYVCLCVSGGVSHYMRQLLEALGYCHDHGIIHCNLQPQFVVIASSGNSSPIKLMGFTAAHQLGLSNVVHAGLSLSHTHARMHMHTHTHFRFTAVWILSKTIRVSRYQKKHSPTHTYRGHHSSLICFIHPLRSMASSLCNFST